MIDNFIKGPLTSLLGFCLMITAFLAWFTDDLTDWQAGAVGIIGFALLFMRDKLPDFVSQFFTAVISKFSSNKPKE